MGGERGERFVALPGFERAAQRDVVGRVVQRRAQRVDPRDDVHADGQVERVVLRRERLVEPAAREVERVAGPQRDVEHDRARAAELLRVALRPQWQVEHRLVDEPALLAGRLEHEDVVRVVVDREPLGGSGRVVGVDLHRMAELELELPREGRDRLVRDVQRLEHDRGAVGELGEDAAHVRRRP